MNEQDRDGVPGEDPAVKAVEGLYDDGTFVEPDDGDSGAFRKDVASTIRAAYAPTLEAKDAEITRLREIANQLAWKLNYHDTVDYERQESEAAEAAKAKEDKLC